MLPSDGAFDDQPTEGRDRGIDEIAAERPQPGLEAATAWQGVA
jgi:hypothetical protein